MTEDEEEGFVIKGQNLGISLCKSLLWAYPGCICGWDFQQTYDNPQAGIHGALMRRTNCEQTS